MNHKGSENKNMLLPYRIREFKSKIFGIKEGILNLIKWYNVIYYDRDFDQCYIYKILATKLEHMEDFFKNDAWSTKADKEAHRIMIAKNLAKRLSNENYLTNATIEYDKLYSDKDLFDSEPTENPKLGRLINVGTKHQNKMFDRACKHSEYMEQQDKDMLFDLIKKNIDAWWD